MIFYVLAFILFGIANWCNLDIDWKDMTAASIVFGGLFVFMLEKDMAKTVAFYRTLGLPIPAKSAERVVSCEKCAATAKNATNVA